MSRVVVDASVVLKALTPIPERHADSAHAIMEAWDEGRLDFVAPQLLYLEVLNVAARKWGLAHAQLLALAATVHQFDIDVRVPDLARVVDWSDLGLSAYDAAYVAVAEAAGIPLVTDDEQIIATAPERAVALASFQPPFAP